MQKKNTNYKNFPKAQRRMILEVENPEVGKALYEHVKGLDQLESDEPEYFIWRVMEEYMAMYSRKSHSISCYYQGYGHVCIVAPITRFKTLKQVLKHVANCADKL